MVIKFNPVVSKINILFFLLIACPGFYLGSTLINICDIIIPIMFIQTLFRQKVRKIRVDYLMFFLSIYVILAFLSILFASIRYETIYFNALAKWLRLMYLPMVYYIMCHNFENDINYYLKYILYSGCFSSLLGILLYFGNSKLYQPPQEIVLLNGDAAYRAGGVFADPACFSLVLLLVLIVAFFYSREQKKNILVLLTAVFSIGGIFISTNRTAIVCLLLLVVILLIKASFPKKIKYLFLILFIMIIILSLYILNKDFQFVVNTRFVPLISLSSYSNLEIISAGRTLIWSNKINTFFSNFDFVNTIWGMGYKVDFNVNAPNIFLADNNFLSTLLGMGILGFTVLILWWIQIFHICKYECKPQYGIISSIIRGSFLVFFIYSLLGDALTMYRASGMLIGLYALFSKNKLLKLRSKKIDLNP